MSTRGYCPPSLSEAELRALISDALENAPGTANETYHARFDHLERGITLDDVIYGLEFTWKFSKPPQFDQNHWQWKYLLLTQSVDGDVLEILVAVDTSNRSFEVITRW